ncbi:hypothetical protein OSB04_029283 [Centaurea solstitialis]|uniref:Uncharacterized protein n=1 Tax=Centaurea solstitialis TaxID=347529 RepID=A0AA38W1E4_9ASTR|nr:hypothetical protein OSB04_029283 [Centaurea solstitialis]
MSSGQVGKKGGNVVGSSQHKEAQKNLRLNVIQKFCRWMYDAGIPFNAVKYDSLKLAFQEIAEYGVDLKPPSYHEAQVPMLKLEKEHTKKLLKENDLEKKTFGCSLMTDGWRDREGRALINFLVNTPRGSIFIESVDASSYSHTGDNLFKLFDQFIQKVGPDDVVQIVTDSASNNVLAGKLVEEKYPHIYWTLCAAHCIDLMLEDIFKLPHLKKALKRAHEDPVCHDFYHIKLISDSQKELRKMFTSKKWTKSKFAKDVGGRQMANTILLPTFWNNIDIAVKGCFVWSTGKESLLWDIFKKRWIGQRSTLQLHQPLHAAGHYLNPALFYNDPNIAFDHEVTTGLFACFHKLTLNEVEEEAIHSEFPIYRAAQEIFKNPIAIKMRSKLAPAEWWAQYGAETPTLQKFAVNVLSLTCSSSGCERNWSVFEHLHSKKRNRLKQQKLNDLVYIKYNRALRRRHDARDTIDPIILDDTNVQDPHEWLMGVLEDEEDDMVHEGEDLTWTTVADAMGVDEPLYAKERGCRDIHIERHPLEGVPRLPHLERDRGRHLIDEDDFDFGEESEEEHDTSSDDRNKETSSISIGPLVYRLLKLALVLPIATATVERCFSAMKLVKSALRNRICDNFLNVCVICAVEKEVLAKVTNQDVMTRFRMIRPVEINLCNYLILIIILIYCNFYYLKCPHSMNFLDPPLLINPNFKILHFRPQICNLLDVFVDLTEQPLSPLVATCGGGRQISQQPSHLPSNHLSSRI